MQPVPDDPVDVVSLIGEGRGQDHRLPFGVVVEDGREVLGVGVRHAHTREPFEDRTGLRHRLEGRTGRPRLGGGSPPRSVDQTDRHIERPLQRAAEVVRDRREAGGRGTIADDPRPLHIVLRLGHTGHRRVEHPDLRVVRRREVDVGLAAPVEGPLHVGLAGAQPDFAHQHVRDDPLLRLEIARHRHGPDAKISRGARGGQGGQADHPPTGGVGAGPGRRTIDALQRDPHLLAGQGPAPDRHFPPLLQDHAVGEDRRQFQSRPRGVDEGQYDAGREGDAVPHGDAP